MDRNWRAVSEDSPVQIKDKQKARVEGEVVVPEGLGQYVIGRGGGNIKRLRSMSGVDFLQYYSESGVIKMICQSEDEMVAVKQQIEDHINKYDPNHMQSCDYVPPKRHQALVLARWTNSTCKRRIEVPVGAASYIVGHKGSVITELRRIPGINYVDFDAETDHTILRIAGNEEAAVVDVNERVEGKIAEFTKATRDGIRRRLDIPKNIVSYVLHANAITPMQSTPGIHFIAILAKEGVVEICGQTTEVVHEIEFKMRDLLSRYIAQGPTSSFKQLHYDIIPQASENISFVPVCESDLVDFTLYLPFIRSHQGEASDQCFFHLSDRTKNSEQSWILDLTDCSRYVLLSTELMVENFGDILDQNHFLFTTNPRVDVKLGITAFYDMYLRTPTFGGDNDEFDDFYDTSNTRNVLHWWDYKHQFSASLKISQDKLSSVLIASGFEEKGTESHTTVHVLDLKNATEYNAIFVGDATSVGDNDEADPELVRLSERKTKHLTLDIVKPLGSMSTRTVLISENAANNPPAKQFLASVWRSGRIFEENILSSDRAFSVEDVRIVRNMTFWDGVQYGVYIEEVEEKGTHSHGQFVTAVEVGLTCHTLNQKLLDIQDGVDGSDSGADTASGRHTDKTNLIAECKELFRKLVAKGRELADKVNTLQKCQ